MNLVLLFIAFIAGYLVSGLVLFPHIRKIKQESEDTYFYYQIYVMKLHEKIKELGGKI